MKISSLKFIIFLNICSSLMVMSSSSLMSMWLGIEILSFTFPPIIVATDSSLVSKINSWKYFMVQCYSSSIFLLSVLCLSFSSPNLMNSNFLWMMMILSMFMKMGMLPFQGWMVQISMSMGWNQFLILSTIQKIGPLIVISESSKMLSSQLCADLIISSIISVLSISGMVMNSSRHILVTSSIINSMWMISASQISKTSFTFFMVLYFAHLWILISTIKEEQSILMDSMLMSGKKEFSNEMCKFILIMSLIGMPPTMGFFIKLSVLDQMITSNQMFSALIMMISSAALMMLYMKMMISHINSLRIKFKQFNPSISSSLSILMIMLSPFLYFT